MRGVDPRPVRGVEAEAVEPAAGGHPLQQVPRQGGVVQRVVHLDLTAGPAAGADPDVSEPVGQVLAQPDRDLVARAALPCRTHTIRWSSAGSPEAISISESMDRSSMARPLPANHRCPVIQPARSP
ncbi:hypothetical protein GCM10027612_78140 [Microbispora bryophytorum subsp. camponoti]